MKKKIFITSLTLVIVSLVVFAVLNNMIMQYTAKRFFPVTFENVNEQVLEHSERAPELFEYMRKNDIFLVSTPNNFETTDQFIMRLAYYGLPLIIAAIFFIVIMIYICTRILSQKITTPLEELSKGAERIKDGVFDIPINYMSNDEFGKVCKAFDSMQESLLLSQRKNLEMENARTDMIAGISHDLRTPLTSVKGYIKGISDGVAATPEKQKRYLDTAYRRACDMDILLERLFFISQVDSGAMPTKLSTIDFCELLKNFRDVMLPELELAGVELELSIPQNPCILSLDKELFNRVLSNLTENAVKYANTQNITIKLTLYDDKKYAYLTFADNGQGVAEEHIHKLFERFWREDKARTSDNGTGLGLYVVKHIITSHGGEINARNNGGLTFDILLPLNAEGSNNG